MSETKKVLRFFTPDNYEKEEAFLTEMSRKGWHFIRFKVFVYEFEKGQPMNYVYKLDYKRDKKEDKDNYLAMFKDCGWENIYEFRMLGGVWEYFRKISDTGEDQLFTDNESKIDLLVRIRRGYIFIAIFFLGINMANLANLISIFERGYFISFTFIFILYTFVIYLYVKIFVRISMKISKLRKAVTND